MRSKISQRILKETTPESKERVKKMVDLILAGKMESPLVTVFTAVNNDLVDKVVNRKEE